MPTVHPVTGISVSDCDLGTPVNTKAPISLFNVQGLKLKNVARSGEKTHNETLLRLLGGV